MRHGNFNRKDSPFAGQRTNTNIMTEEVPQSSHNRKTESDAARVCRTNLIILFEYPCDVLSRYSDPAIPHFYSNLICGATTADQYPSLISVAYRIRNEITDHFFEHSRITTD